MRRAFWDAYEGDCLPTGEFSVPLKNGPVETHLGQIETPPEGPIRFVRLTNLGGFRFAGVSQDGQYAWEWAQQRPDGAALWRNVGPAYGTAPLIYDRDGVLRIMQNGGAGTPSTGYVYVDEDTGALVLTWETYSGPPLWGYTRTGPFIVGQAGNGGIVALAGGKSYLLETGETTVVRAKFDWPQKKLAYATRKLRENETVVAIMTLEEVFAALVPTVDTPSGPTLPPAPPPPPVIIIPTPPPVVTPPVVTPPVIVETPPEEEDDHMPQLKLPAPTFDQWVMQDAPKVYAAFTKKNGRPPSLQDASFQTMRYFHYWIGITENGKWRVGEYWPVERMVAHELGEDDSPERFPQP